MDFALTEDEALLRDAAASFAAGELRPRDRAHEAGPLADEVATTFESMGVAGLWASDDDVGDAGALARCLVVEALAGGDAGTTAALLGPAWARSVATTLGVGTDDRAEVGFVHPVDTIDSGQEAIGWLPIRDAARILVFDREGAWRLLQTRCEPIKALGLRGAGASRCTLGPEIGAGTVETHRCAEARAELARIAGAMLVGLAGASLAYASAYVQERRAFGRPLAQHQGLAFIVSEMAMATDAARLLLHAAAAPDAAPASAAHAYLECLDAALHVTSYGVQLLGGHGYVTDHPVEKWMRDARAVGLLWGGRDAASRDACADAWEGSWT